jgi:hypothetical protein
LRLVFGVGVFAILLSSLLQSESIQLQTQRNR